MSSLLHHLVDDAASRDPRALSVVDGERSLDYSTLAERSARLSQLLASLGVRRGDRVGLFLDKSLEAVVGIHGVLRAGAAYVPFDTTAPLRRIAYIAADCDTRIVLTSRDLAPQWQGLVDGGAPIRHLVVLDADGDDDGSFTDRPDGVELVDGRALDAFPARSADPRTIDRDLAYILYTSGSTGNPKGVMLSHANGMAFAGWSRREFGMRPDDHVAQVAPLVFDLSTFDLFSSAEAGAALHLAHRSTTALPSQFRRFLETRSITVVYAVPSILTALVERARLELGDLPALRLVLFAGEVFPTKHLSRLMAALPHAKFANLYGPTETNVCTFWRVSVPVAEHDPPLTIGRAIPNDETIVVTDAGTVAAVGEVGELHVRGATVMQGYWGDPERTARTLIANPFAPALRDPLYRTGDLVREEPDGTYTFLGRRDNQIKRRGYRVELGEVESALLAHPDVVECAVCVLGAGGAPQGDTTLLVAHVVAAEGLDEDTLLRFAAERIPRYMIPDAVEHHTSLPKTTTGKIDRAALTRAAVTSEGPR